MFKRSSLLIPNPESGSVIISETVVVVEIFVKRGDVFVLPYITIGENATKYPDRKPFKYKIDEVNQQINDGDIEVGSIELEAFRNIPEEELIDKDGEPYPSTVERDRRYAIVLDLLALEDELFYPTHGMGLIAKVVKQHCTTQTNAQRYLNEFFRGGRNKNALISRRGRHSSASKSGGRKVGRKRASAKHGINGKSVDEQDKIFIKRIAKKYYLSKKRLSLAKCYVHLKDDFYYKERYLLPDGTYKIKEHKNPNDIISEWQLRDWMPLVLGLTRKQIQAIRRGHSEHKSNFAGRKGNAAPNALGPNHVWQLDSTPIDIELVAPYDRRVLIKVATLYVIRDVYTRSICGIHVGIGPASWSEARLALFHAIRNKVAYAKECGLTIEEDDWVESGSPMFLLVDNEEFQNKLSESVTAHMGINVLYARAYQGDDKGLVESSFHMIHAMARNEQIPGFKYKNLKGRNRNIPQQTASLTPYELKKILIIFAIKHNKATWKKDYPMEQQARFEGVKSVCRDYWLWGEENRGYFMRDHSEREIYLNLLEVGVLTVHKTHLHLQDKGVNYRCEVISNSGFQDKPTLKGQIHKTLKCRYFRGNMSRILIEFKGELVVGKLHSDHRGFENMSLDEIKDAKEHWLALEQLHNIEVSEEVSNSSQAIQGVVNNSKLAKADDIKNGEVTPELDTRAEASEVLALSADAFETDRLNSVIDEQPTADVEPTITSTYETDCIEDEDDEYSALLEEMLNDED